MAISSNAVHALAAEVVGRVQEVRHHLHRNPELSFQEHKTMAYVSERLRQIGIPHETGVAGTGIVGIIEGRSPGKVIALRGDMDALPILEANEVPYKSQNPGVMHACGHDVHTASLLGAAEILWKLRDQFEGTIKLLFQPGEEVLPGGASLMIKEGVLENPNPKAIFGQHVMPLLPVGTLGFRPGMYMASSDEITLRIFGKGGHAAMPHLNVDTVVVMSQILVSLQHVVSRMANPATPSVLSFGKVEANGAFNIIPNEVLVLGTFRTMNEEWRYQAHEKMRRIAETTAEAFGARAEMKIEVGYPFLRNDEALTLRTRSAAVDYLGADKVVDLDIWMAAEDFASYSQKVPGCFYRLGVRNEARGIVSSVHTPTFDIDEAALEIGCGFMAFAALRELAL